MYDENVMYNPSYEDLQAQVEELTKRADELEWALGISDQQLDQLQYNIKELTAEVERLKGRNILSGEPELFVDFVNDVQRMKFLYQKGKYTLAEETRDQLRERLDDIMRIEQTYPEGKEDGK